MATIGSIWRALRWGDGADVTRVLQGDGSYAQGVSVVAGTSAIGTVNQGTSPWVVGGNAASGQADSGNPVKVGGVYRATDAALTDGQRSDLKVTQYGMSRVTLYDWTGTALSAKIGVLGNGNPVSAALNATDASSGGDWAQEALGFYDGSSYQRARGDVANGLWVNVKAAAPTALAAGQTITVTQATAANLKVDASGVAVPVTGTFWKTTQPVSGTVAISSWQGAQDEMLLELKKHTLALQLLLAQITSDIDLEGSLN